MAVQEYKLPDVGEGLTEAEIVTWRVAVGDVIAVNDIVVEIETAKSVVELPSPYAGTVTALLVPEGETVPVGTPIIAVADAAGEAAAAPAQPAASPEPAGDGDAGTPQTLVGYGPKAGAAARRPRRGQATPASAAGEAAQAQVQGVFEPGPSPEPDAPAVAQEVAVPAHSARPAAADQGDGAAGRALAKPPVRKLAKDLGVDLGSLVPTGPEGTVTRADVEAAAAPPEPATSAAAAPAASAAPAAPAAPGAERREPVKSVRKMMAQAMVTSAFTIPHVTEWVTVDVTRTMKLVSRLRGHPDFADVRVSPLLVVARAVCLAMRRTPEANAWWDDAAQEVVYKQQVNLGIAAATSRGLVVPNVKDAGSLSMADLGRAVSELTRTARDGKTQPADMAGGTFTITNVGVFGVDAGTPIINPGESAILAFGAVRPTPWVHKGRVRVRQVTTLALSFDHRFIDGALGSRFLADVAAILHDPRDALLY
jgi:pyruvate dehydrogenase E2 component (dihydrolipoamide acetyltransferase)